jgi:hypothetical protein
MTGAADLERGYRRLLACYPARFRSEHGEELMGVLLAGARDGQRRPGLAESASLLRSALGMRLRPDPSAAARQGWAGALAAFSLAGPVLLVATTVLAGLAWSYDLGPGRFTTLLGLPGFWIMLGFQVVLAALVLAGLRRAALVMTAGYLLALCLSLDHSTLPFPLWSPQQVSLVAISVCILELAALLGSPGPRRGRDLVHWAHGVVLLLCAAALASYTAATHSILAWHHPRLTLLLMVIAMAVIARLARAARLSRPFRLLLAALACPDALLLVSWAFGWYWFSGYSAWRALLFAGPVLTAAVALISTATPRRRQII